MSEKIKSNLNLTADPAVSELKANLNPEQRKYLDVLKAKMKTVLGGKTKQELAKARDVVSLEKYKAILEEILEFLRTKEIRQSELENKFELKKQYEEQFQLLKETGVIKELPDGQWGMIDILGQEQPIPSYDEIRERMESKAEFLDKKREQGFTKLLLVPIGMKLEDLAGLAAKLILKKHEEGNLLATDGTKLKLNENQPVYVNSEYKDADVNGSVLYGVTKFAKENHGGQTKKVLIKEKGGWQGIFIENQPDLPKKGKGKKIGDRNQLEAGSSPEEYLAKIQTEEQYADEQIITPEAQLIYFMEYLQKNNQVIDDWNGKGKGCCTAGAYFKEAGLVPCGVWDREVLRFVLLTFSPSNPDDDISVRSAVII